MIRYGNLAMLLVSFAMAAPLQRTGESILPFRAAVTFSRQCSANAWVAYVHNSRHERSYEIRLEPEIDSSDSVSGWDVTLFDTSSHRRNLLAPRIWHGLQSYMIDADDFRPGVDKPVFGRERTFPVPERSLIVRVKVEDAKVSRNPALARVCSTYCA
jgi:hypothetical protein